jgi:hypothetical protein
MVIGLNPAGAGWPEVRMNVTKTMKSGMGAVGFVFNSVPS